MEFICVRKPVEKAVNLNGREVSAKEMKNMNGREVTAGKNDEFEWQRSNCWEK